MKETGSEESSRPSTILIADDDPAFAMTLSEWLSEAGYRVFRVHSGNKAVALVSKMRDEIDLLMVDIVMADQGGFETIRILHAAAPDLKIIAMSAIVRDVQLEIALMLGAHRALQKPPPDETFGDGWLEVVRGLLSPSRRAGLG